MNGNIALIFSFIVVFASVGVVLFYKNKYSKETFNDEKTNDTDKIELFKKEYSKRKKAYLDKIKQLELEKAITIEEKRFALENNKISLKNIEDQKNIIEEKEEIIQAQKLIIETNSTALQNSIDSQLKEEKFVKSILIVDDSMVVRNKMKKLLENSGYEISTANDGIEALNTLTAKTFNLVITDLEMPNLDGFGLIAKMKENPKSKNIPIMLITGHEEMKININDCENLYYIQKKPWEEDGILKRVEILSNIS